MCGMRKEFSFFHKANQFFQYHLYDLTFKSEVINGGKNLVIILVVVI
jgi:hypothetical protein